MRRILIGGAVVLGLVAAVGVAVRWATRDPMCNGTPVRDLVQVIAVATTHYEAKILAVDRLQTMAPVAVTFTIDALNENTNSLRNGLNRQWAKLRRKLPIGLQRLTPKPRPVMPIDRAMWLTALAELGPHDERVIPALIKEMNHGDAEVRFFATYSLGLIATNWLEHPVLGPTVVKTLARMSQDRAGNVRGTAVVGLGQCGIHAEPHIPRLIDRLSDTDNDTRILALRALVNIGVATNVVLEHIGKLLANNDLATRAYAAYINWKLTGEQGTNLAILREALRRAPETRLRSSAAGYLGWLGHQARIAVPDVKEALADHEFRVSLSAAKALWRITDETERPVILFKNVLVTGDPHEQAYAAEALAEIGARAESAVPEIVEALSVPDYMVRKAAVRAARAIGPAARDALPKLRTLCYDRFPGIRAEAEAAIKAIELSEGQ